MMGYIKRANDVQPCCTCGLRERTFRLHTCQGCCAYVCSKCVVRSQPDLKCYCKPCLNKQTVCACGVDGSRGATVARCGCGRAVCSGCTCTCCRNRATNLPDCICDRCDRVAECLCCKCKRALCNHHAGAREGLWVCDDGCERAETAETATALERPGATCALCHSSIEGAPQVRCHGCNKFVCVSCANADGSGWTCVVCKPPSPAPKRKTRPSSDPRTWDGATAYCKLGSEAWLAKCPAGDGSFAIATLTTDVTGESNGSMERWLESIFTSSRGRVALDRDQLDQLLCAAHADSMCRPCQRYDRDCETTHCLTFRGHVFAACRVRAILRAMRAMGAPATHVYDSVGHDGGNSVIAFASARAPGVLGVLCSINESDAGITPEHRATLPSIDHAA